ncbi:MAG: universal stress protein [Halobacteriales archaeon]|nr:universal stress protein [Halobacteriales archaeon]
MPGSILVGYDGSDASKAALAFAAERAAVTKSKVLLVTVVPANLHNVGFTELLLPGIQLPKLVEGTFEATAKKRLEDVAAPVRKHGVPVDVVVRSGDAADELIAAARDLEADEVVLGHKSYESKLPQGIGSIADKVLRYSDRTVTVVRPRPKA